MFNFLKAQLILLLMMLYYTLERYATLLLTWNQAGRDYQPRQYLLTGNLHCSLFHLCKVLTAALVLSFLNEFPRNISNAFQLGQGPLLAPQSPEPKPSVDQINLRVLPTRLSHSAGSDSSVDFTREDFIYLRNSALFLHLKANKLNLLVQICQNLMIFDRYYHLGIIMRKSFKTKYRLKCAVFAFTSQLPHRIS